ncbi:hypothetical protein [Hyphomicrobium sp. 802]|uniref:hypothetical protein n=1 Tax=Hyphomicrobium sp. 802 TaxID=1112272 RepID=UPI0004B05C37|nr:hypothetical protein [Hyphomicrobium sp. 802]
MPIIPNDKISRVADLAGRYGKAWRVDFAALCKKHGVAPEHDSGIAGWVVEAPWAHPLWHSYELVLIHLREIAGTSAPIIHLPDATHELWLNALDPDHPREPFIIGESPSYPLRPGNFAAQIIAENDEAARARVFAAVEQICAGTLSPDTDCLAQWIALFGDNMIRPAFRPSAATFH